MKVKAGQIVLVENKNRKKFSNARYKYYAFWVEDYDGDNERCFLLTESELKRVEDRANKNREDWITATESLPMVDVRPRRGRLVPVWNQHRKFNANSYYYSVIVEDHDGSNKRCLLLTKTELNNAEHRASKNPEDLTEKGFWTNLFD